MKNKPIGTVRTCRKCRKARPLDHFIKTPDGRIRTCNDCRTVPVRQIRRTEKTCRKCNKVKTVEHFAKSPQGRIRICNDCQSVKAKQPKPCKCRRCNKHLPAEFFPVPEDGGRKSRHCIVCLAAKPLRKKPPFRKPPTYSLETIRKRRIAMAVNNDPLLPIWKALKAIAA